MKDLMISLRLFIFMSLLLGVGYPLLMTTVAQSVFASQAGGSLILKDRQIIGSRLLAQKFVGEKYFRSRPSAGDYNPLPSGGSNLGPSSSELLKSVEERRVALQVENGPGSVPEELLFASASGLDPEISPEAAKYQVSRVAKARGLDAKRVDDLVSEQTLGPQFGILGEPRVNVLALNLALDAAQK